MDTLLDEACQSKELAVLPRNAVTQDDTSLTMSSSIHGSKIGLNFLFTHSNFIHEKFHPY